MSTYSDKREQRERPIPDCGKVGLSWSPEDERCVRPAPFDQVNTMSTGLGDLEYDFPPWPAGDGMCYCDAECFAYGDCCSNCGGQQGGGGGGGGDVIKTPWDWAFAPPPPEHIPIDWNFIGTSIGDPSDPGAGFWDWFNSWFPPAEPGTLEPIPIDWTQIGTSIGCPPGQYPAVIGRPGIDARTGCVDYPPSSYCPPGTGPPPNCPPFDPPNTAKGQAQRKAAAAAQRQQQNAQNAQQQLQQAAQQCAAKGGRLVRTQTGYACQLPNGQLENVNLSGLPSWLVPVLLGLAAVVILKR